MREATATTGFVLEIHELRDEGLPLCGPKPDSWRGKKMQLVPLAPKRRAGDAEDPVSQPTRACAVGRLGLRFSASRARRSRGSKRSRLGRELEGHVPALLPRGVVLR